MENNNSYNILIVDDSQNNIDYLISILKKENYHIASARNGKSAIIKARANRFDLILLDIIMEDIDGYTVCKELKKLPETKDIPVIFLTGLSDSDSINKGFDCGAVDYVKKPYNSTELNSRVITHLELKRSKDIINKKNKQLENKNEELEKLSIVASNTDNSVMIFDVEGNIEWVNEGFTRLTGYTLEEYKIKTGSNIMSCSNKENFKEDIEKMILGKKSICYTSYNTSKDGNNLWFQTTINPIFETKGELKRFVVIDTDITLIKEAEQEILDQNEEIKTQNDIIISAYNELKYKNAQITESIKYAKFIQEALLVNPEIFLNYFPESFILYLPKDIVSGDFYWTYAEGDLTVFAVVDCTGHGVPGAFMSMIGTTILNNIVKEEKIFQPSKILEKLNEEIKYILNQNKAKCENENGMDITLMCYNKKIEKITISLINHKMLVIKNNEISILKGDSFLLGRCMGNENVEAEPKFKEYELKTEKGMCVYLFTDGYQDQQRQSDKKRFSSKRLRELFEKICHLKMTEQKKALSESFNNWKEKMKQTDDVLVVGIKF